MSMPGKGNSENDIIRKMKAQAPWYMGDQVAKCIRHVRCLDNLPRKKINECLIDSATYAASQNKRDLKQEFRVSRAEDGWLRWHEHTESQTWGNPFTVRIDWASKVVARENLGEYCCLEDVEACLYGRDEKGQFIHKRQPTSLVTRPVTPLADITEAQAELDALPETERRATIDARLGQGKYRQELIGVWGRCAVTKCKSEQLLRASHIKPWRDSNKGERLDKFNGLLLTPALDHLFDRGLISFDDEGGILLSSQLKQVDALLLGVRDDMKLCYVDEKHKPYLAEHRRMYGF